MTVEPTLCRIIAYLLVVSWTGLALAADEVERLPQQHFTIDDRPAFLILPADKPEGPIPWVLYAPAFQGKLPGPEEEWMFRQFTQAGMAIAGVDIGESYGSPRGRATFDALYSHLTQQYELDRQACLLARSRGGLMLYCWAVDNPEKVKCVAGIYPVCNLSSYPGLAKACGAYRLSAAELQAQLDQHNPIARITALAPAKIPIFHVHGDVDKLVPLEDNSQPLKDRYTAAGGEMTLQVAKGQGHNMWQGFFQCQELVDFVIGQATK